MPDAREPDPVLASEQRYLDAARVHLNRMRERTLGLEVAGVGVDRFATDLLAGTLWRRAQALVDDPGTTLFFGRTDHATGERWYIGRRHVSDDHGDPVVIDWRADVACAFYRASQADPLGLVRRRRFGVEGGQLTAYEDESLGHEARAASSRSALLAREIERPRVGPMRDIVSTIQPEQDDIVRSDLDLTLCVQGAPGTGKTAVGLHRAAWLLYTHRERLKRSGVLVIGPNRSFLDHVGAVLPSLGEVDVRHTTIGGLTASVPVRGRDGVAGAALKGDVRLAELLRRAVRSYVTEPREPLVLPRGSRRWRLPAGVCAEIVGELRERGVRYLAARELLPQRLAHALLVLMEDAGESPDDRVQDAVARSTPVRRFVEAVWPVLEPRTVLYRLYSDPDFLAEHADGLLERSEQELLLWQRPPRSPGSARWTAADAVLLDEIADLLRRTPSLGHVVLDEAQDLSPMQLRAVGRRCSTGSATVLGDIAQGTSPWATPSWEVALAHLGHPDAHVEELDRGFRVPAAVIGYAARLLPEIAPGLRAPTSVRDAPGSLDEMLVTEAGGLVRASIEAVRAALTFEGSVGLIVADGVAPAVASALSIAGIAHDRLGEDAPDPSDPASGAEVDSPLPRVSLVPATIAKGLEFDHVVIVEPADIVDAEPDERTGLRRLYVVLTRAVSRLTVVRHRPLPTSLGPIPAPAPDPAPDPDPDGKLARRHPCDHLTLES